MVVIKSERAKNLLQNPRAIEQNTLPHMRKYNSNDLNLWVNIEREQQNVKKLSFSGNLKDHEKVLLEAVSALMKGKPINFADNLSLRECEAFLRDRNSQEALENLDPEEEQKFKKFFQWLRIIPQASAPQEYHFSSQKGPFAQLKLIEKIKELKAFLNSFEIQDLYRDAALPELIDVEDLTVYLQAPYHSEKDKALFEELHILGVQAFQEENLNFIPEA